MSEPTLALLALAWLLALIAGVVIWRRGGPYAPWGRTLVLALGTLGVGFVLAHLLRRPDPTPGWTGERLPRRRLTPIPRIAEALDDLAATEQELEALDERTQGPADPADPAAGADFAEQLRRLRHRP